MTLKSPAKKRKAFRPLESAELLKRAFDKLKELDGLSLRRWAALVSLTPSYLNLVLNSKRIASKETLEVLGKSLDFDKLAMKHLDQAHARDWLTHKGMDASGSGSKSSKEVVELLEDDSTLLKSFIHIALLEFSTCANFKEDPVYLGKLFGVKTEAVKRALSDLIGAGFLAREDGLLVKKNKKMRIPTKRSRTVVRDFHAQMLGKALDELKTADQEAYEKRLITGYTVAVNAENFKKAEVMLQQALIDVATQLSDGECTDVYQLQVQLFPLSKNPVKA